MKKVGRPKGSVKPKTVSFHRRVRPEIAKIFDGIINEIKTNYKDKCLDECIFYKDSNEFLIQIFIKNNVFTNKDI